MVSNSIFGIVGLGLALLVGSKLFRSGGNSSLPEIPSLPQAESDFDFTKSSEIRNQISEIATGLRAQRSGLEAQADEIRSAKLFDDLGPLQRSVADALNGLRNVSFDQLNPSQKLQFTKASVSRQFNLAKEPFIESNINPNIALIDENLGILQQTLNQIPIPNSV